MLSDKEEIMENTNNQFGYAITIVDHNKKQWVRVQAMGEDFIIAPHDLKDAKGQVMTDCTQSKLMERLEELELTTFNRKQGFIIAILIEEINVKLIEVGGDKFAEDLYISSELRRPVSSSADYDYNYMWCFDGYNGCFSSTFQCYSDFRSRPIINYNTKKN